jgi:hypothetical protein
MDALDHCITELECTTLDGQLFSVSDYLYLVEMALRELDVEKNLYRYDLVALLEIEREILLMDELKHSTLRALDKSQGYHRRRKDV